MDSYLKAFEDAIGKQIANLTLEGDDALHFQFEDGTKVKLWDDGQKCCEKRYMTTDDVLADYVGAKIMGLELKDAPAVEDDYESHEVQFLEIQTSKGCLTMATHNEHNGYYGGFWVRAEAE